MNQHMMNQATLWVHAELNDFLARARRNRSFSHAFRDRVSLALALRELAAQRRNRAACLDLLGSESRDARKRISPLRLTL